MQDEGMPRGLRGFQRAAETLSQKLLDKLRLPAPGTSRDFEHVAEDETTAEEPLINSVIVHSKNCKSFC